MGDKQYGVDSIEDASKKYRKVIDAADLGSSQVPADFFSPGIVDGSGKLVGHIAYNGKVFPGEKWEHGIEPLYNLYAETDLGASEKKEPVHTGMTVAKLRELNALRSKRAQSIDNARSNQLTVENESPRVSLWTRHPGALDVLGVDTPPGIVQPSVPHRLRVKTPKPPAAKPARKPKAMRTVKPAKGWKPVPQHYGGGGVTRRSDRKS